MCQQENIFLKQLVNNVNKYPITITNMGLSYIVNHEDDPYMMRPSTRTTLRTKEQQFSLSRAEAELLIQVPTMILLIKWRRVRMDGRPVLWSRVREKMEIGGYIPWPPIHKPLLFILSLMQLRDWILSLPCKPETRIISIHLLLHYFVVQPRSQLATNYIDTFQLLEYVCV